MNPEIIQWAFVVKMYRDVLINGADGLLPTSVFALDNEDGVKRWKDLQNRVVEHVSVFTFFFCFGKNSIVG